MSETTRITFASRRSERVPADAACSEGGVPQTRTCMPLMCRCTAVGIVLLLAGFAAGAAADNASAPEAPINIGSRLELFVDRLLVDTLDGADFRLHHPQKMPLPESPLKGGYASVIKDGDLYRGYYRGSRPGYTGPRALMTCYAESEDGKEWTFPELGICEIDGSRENNVIIRKNDHSHNFSPFIDTNPDAPPDRRYKALAMGRTKPENERALCGFVSADGIHWDKIQKQPVIVLDPPEEAFDSQNVSFWSPAEQKYVCYFRTWKTPHGHLRTISRTTSPDFIHWSDPVAMEPNLPGEHLYTSQTHPYSRAPHIYIALPTRYIAGRVDGKPADSGMIGSTDVLFMTSRAGSEKYDRLFTEAFIRPGLDPERWGNRANYMALNVVPAARGEMSIYHAKSGHRYVLRTDGFVSIHAGPEPGEMRTRPLTFHGNDLVINYSTSAAGTLAVEVQTEDGKPVPGFFLRDCVPITGDHIERSVVWRSGADLGALAGKPVRLRFVMTECDLYSIQFKTKSRAQGTATEAPSGTSAEYVARDNATGVQIDGRLDEEFWKAFPRQMIGSLKELHTGRPPRYKTHYKVAWGSDNLFFAIRCEDEPGAPLSITGQKNDDESIWTGDVVEIMLDTGGLSYYQIAINPAGVVTDLRREKRKLFFPWSSHVEVATQINREDGGWTIEARIPVVAEGGDGVVGEKPKERRPWFFNLCRQRVRNDDKEHSACGSLGEQSWHNRRKFVMLYVE